MPTRFAAVTVDMDTLMADISIGSPCRCDDARIRRLSYSRVLPRILELLSKLKIKATFFIIGKDALDSQNRKMIREISGQGHEIANHSLLHERLLCNFNEQEFVRDVSESAKALSDIAGEKIVGFRMPGAVIHRNNLMILARMGYLYDSSLNKSVIYNLAKRCYAQLFTEKKLNIPSQGFKSFFAPSGPYFPGKDNIYENSQDNLGILEVPITAVPWASIPFMSYFLLALGNSVTRFSYELTRSKNRFINLVAHDSELALWEDYREFGFSYHLCGWHMKKDIGERKDFLTRLISMIGKDYRIITLKEYCKLAADGSGI